MKIFLLIFIVFFFFTALSAQDNTWIEVSPQENIPAHYSGLRFVGQMAHGYGNLVCRPSSGTFLYMDCLEDNLSSGCRRPNSFYANAICSWNPQGNTLEVLKVGNWGGGSYGNGCLLPEFANDTTPAPRHTYEGFVYVDSTDALYLMLGAYTRIMSGSPTPEAQAMYTLDNQSTWKYTFSNNRWHRIASHVSDVSRVRSNYETHMVHWPSGRKILWAGHYGWEHAEFDLATETWQAVTTTNRSPFSLYGALSDWDSKRDIWIFRNGDSVATYDPATKTYTALPGSGLSKSNICYISDHDVYLATGSSAGQTKIYDPNTQQWTAINGGSITFECNSDLYMRYDPVTGKAGIVTDASTPRYYTFKYVPETTAIDAGQISEYGAGIRVSPNPFYSNTTINIDCRLKIVDCRLKIYNINGKMVDDLTSKIKNLQSSILNQITWKTSRHGPGIYLVKLSANNKSYIRRITLLK
jgi:hypothetical protein